MSTSTQDEKFWWEDGWIEQEEGKKREQEAAASSSKLTAQKKAEFSNGADFLLHTITGTLHTLQTIVTKNNTHLVALCDAGKFSSADQNLLIYLQFLSVDLFHPSHLTHISS